MAPKYTAAEIDDALHAFEQPSAVLPKERIRYALRRTLHDLRVREKGRVFPSGAFGVQVVDDSEIPWDEPSVSEAANYPQFPHHIFPVSGRVIARAASGDLYVIDADAGTIRRCGAAPA